MNDKRLIVCFVGLVALASLAGAVWLFSVNQAEGAAAVLPIAGTALGLLAPSLLAHPRPDDEAAPVNVVNPEPIPVDVEPAPVEPRRRTEPLKGRP